MSTGDSQDEDRRAHYELRMPLYEMAHRRGLRAGSFRSHSLFERRRRCPADQEKLHCGPGQGSTSAPPDYEFPPPSTRWMWNALFTPVTVSNHVHLLRVVNGDRRDQALFDFSFPKPLSVPPANAHGDRCHGIRRWHHAAVGGLVQVLFLASLVLAARSRRELLPLAACFWPGR